MGGWVGEEIKRTRSSEYKFATGSHHVKVRGAATQVNHSGTQRLSLAKQSYQTRYLVTGTNTVSAIRVFIIESSFFSDDSVMSNAVSNTVGVTLLSQLQSFSNFSPLMATPSSTTLLSSPLFLSSLHTGMPSSSLDVGKNIEVSGDQSEQ